MTVNRVSRDIRKLVYLICASRRVAYSKGSSPIVYIGTTKNGIDRVAQSAAFHSDEVLRWHGVDSVQVRIVTCGARQNVRTWHKLERAFLLVFRERYGEVPYCNTAGRNIQATNEFRFFSRKRIEYIIDRLAQTGVAPARIVQESNPLNEKQNR
jgi:hypothetical protein